MAIQADARQRVGSGLGVIDEHVPIAVEIVRNQIVRQAGEYNLPPIVTQGRGGHETKTVAGPQNQAGINRRIQFRCLAVLVAHINVEQPVLVAIRQAAAPALKSDVPAV